MNLKSRLQQDLERAVRDRDSNRKSAIRLVRAAIQNEEIALAAREAIAETKSQGLQHVGQVMRVLMPRVRGNADGSTVNQVVKELLAASG